MAGEGLKAVDFTKGLRNDPMKAYYTYDGNGRLEYAYETGITAKEGDPALVTQYSYDGVTTRVKKFKEYMGAWPAGADI